MSRADVEGLGWVFAAEQEGYVRAEKFTVQGDLVNFAGVTVDEVVAAIDAWENYPVQAPDTRGVPGNAAAAPVEEAPVEAPVEAPPDVQA